jgi:hypothetical protein
MIASSKSASSSFATSLMNGLARQDAKHSALDVTASDEYGDTAANKFAYPFMSEFIARHSLWMPVNCCVCFCLPS